MIRLKFGEESYLWDPPAVLPEECPEDEAEACPTPIGDPAAELRDPAMPAPRLGEVAENCGAGRSSAEPCFATS